MEYGITKRQKIIISTIIVTIGFLFTTQSSNIIFRNQYFLGLVVVCYLISLWAFLTDMTKQKALVVLALPVFYTIALTLFYFLFREIRWLTRLPVAIFFGLSFYLLLLTQNVFNIASIRNIPLYRAAVASSFIFTILTLVLLSAIVFAFNLPFYLNGLVMMVISFILLLQMFWTVEMDKINPQILIYALVMSLVVGEAAVAFSFWSQIPIIKALLMSPIIYTLIGISNEQLRNKLNRGVALEYSLAGGVLFVVIFLINSFSSLNL